MGKPKPRMRQLVDWRAALWAGLFAGMAFLVLNLVLTPLVLGGNMWVIVRLWASLLMGSSILAPPATFHLLALPMALLVNFGLSFGFALLIAYVVHRGGLITGIAGGAALGLAIYGIVIYAGTHFFPWYFPMRSGVMIYNFIAFGGIAGGVYEYLEVEIFVPVAAAKGGRGSWPGW